MKAEDFSIIGKALLSGFTVEGKFGSNKYNLVDLVKSSDNTLKALYNDLKDLYRKYENSEDIFDDDNTSTQFINDINHKMSVIRIIVMYRKEENLRLETKRLELKEINKELSLINKALEKDKIESIMKSSPEELLKRKEELLNKSKV